MNIELLLTGFDPSNIPVSTSIAPLLIGALIAGAVSLIVGVYTFLQMRKMQKKNRPKPNQLDGTIADEGISFYDLAGSPHVHANITDIWDKSTKAIKKKSGGFLGIGSTSQVTGYRYYAKFAAFIGNRIEKLLAINFDNRKWVVHDPLKHPPNLLPVLEGNLFGENEGGVSGNIDIHFGTPDQEPNAEYQKYFPLVSGYPYQSYLVFRGLTSANPLTGKQTTAPGFYLGNSGYMKEMLLWVKRTRVRNDGRVQWYEIRGDGAIVCEIGSYQTISNTTQSKIPHADFTYKTGVTAGDNEISYGVIHNEQVENFERLRVALDMGGAGGSSNDEDQTIKVGYKLDFSPVSKIKIIIETSRDGSESVRTIGNILSYEKKIKSETELTYEYVVEAGYFEFILIVSALNSAFAFIEHVTIESYPFSYVANNDHPDINPIHKIREILTDDTAMGKPETDINDMNFMKAADRIYDEGLGVSWAIDEKSCIEAIDELCYHIEAGIRVNRQTGLYEMVLFRDDWFSEDEIHDIAENRIKDLSLEVMNSDDIVNQLNVTYYDRQRIKNSTFSVYENGSILTMGHANAESIEFPYFMNMRNAEIVANWKLKQYSTPAWKGTFTTGWREARKWNRYDLIKITWSKKWQGTILARIMKIDLGNGLNNEVMIDFEEVVPYSGEMNTSIVVDDSTEEKAEPAKPAIGETFEAPYYIAVQNIGQRKIDEELAYNPDVGFTFSTYRRPQWNALYTEITTINADAPENGWVIDGSAEFVTGGQFDQVVSKTATQISVKNINIEDSFGSGDLIVAGSGLINIIGLYEFMIVEDFDRETNILTVKRGVLDTLPTQWDADGWFFVSNADDGLFSLTDYSAGQNVRASSLTVTPSSKLEQLGSSFVSMRSRAIRPYPPANVKFNDIYYPETILVTSDIVLTWVDRNRLQQTGGVILSFFDGGVIVEPGTTYSYELISENVVLDSASGITLNTAKILASLLIPNKPHTLKLWSVRDGFTSYQIFEHSFFVESASLILTASATKSQVTGNTVPTANIMINVDESLRANMRFNGSRISGKAPAGSIITIEVEE